MFKLLNNIAFLRSSFCKCKFGNTDIDRDGVAENKNQLCGGVAPAKFDTIPYLYKACYFCRTVFVLSIQKVGGGGGGGGVKTF